MSINKDQPGRLLDHHTPRMPVDWTNVTASVLKSMAQEPLVNREYSLGGLAWNSWFESMNLLMVTETKLDVRRADRQSHTAD